MPIEVIGETVSDAADAEVQLGFGDVDSCVGCGGDVLTHTCKCEPRLVHPAALFQRFEFRNKDVGAEVLQNASRPHERMQSSAAATHITTAQDASLAMALLSSQLPPPLP